MVILQTQHIPYPSAHGPPAIPPLTVHSLFGTQLPYSPDGAWHNDWPHWTTVNNERTELNIYYFNEIDMFKFKNLFLHRPLGEKLQFFPNKFWPKPFIRPSRTLAVVLCEYPANDELIVTNNKTMFRAVIFSCCIDKQHISNFILLPWWKRGVNSS